MLQVYGSTASFIFAYQGQSIFLEVMREMKEPGDFPKTVTVANMTMMIVYLAITILCYHYKGGSIKPFLPDAIETRWIQAVVGSLVHILNPTCCCCPNPPFFWHNIIVPDIPGIHW